MADEKPVAQAGGGGHGRRGGGPHAGPHEEPHEGAPEWLISFADNVMLQMGFFVILLALAMQSMKTAGVGSPGPTRDAPSNEQLDWAIAVREAFNNPVDANSSDPADRLLVQRLLVRKGFTGAASPGRRGAEHDIKSIRPSDYYGLGGTIPFEQDAGELSDDGRAAVAELLEHLRGHRNIVEIRGHVSAAEAFNTSDRGMLLSYQRARAVAEALTAGGIGWDQMRLIACGHSDPLVRGRYDQVGHRENQRVELIVTDAAVPEPDASPPP